MSRDRYMRHAVVRAFSNRGPSFFEPWTELFRTNIVVPYTTCLENPATTRDRCALTFSMEFYNVLITLILPTLPRVSELGIYALNLTALLGHCQASILGVVSTEEVGAEYSTVEHVRFPCMPRCDDDEKMNDERDVLVGRKKRDQ